MSLGENHTLIAQILSYVITNTYDLAQLRRVSKQWNENSVLTYALKQTPFLKNCLPASNNNDDNNDDDNDNDDDNNNNTKKKKTKKPSFLAQLVQFGEDCEAGKFFDGNEFPSHEIPPWLQADATVISLLVVGPTKKIPQVNISKVENDDDDCDRFSSYCKLLHETQSWEEFQQVSEKAVKEGMFLSLDNRKQAKSTGANFPMKTSDEGDVPVILGVTVPKKGTSTNPDSSSSSSSSTTKLLLQMRCDPEWSVCPFVKRFDDDNDDDDDDTGESMMSTFVGYNVTENSMGTVNCHIPLALSRVEPLLEECLYEDATSYIPLDTLLRKYQEQSIREGVAIADGIVPHELHTNLIKQIDAFANDQVIDYHPNSNNVVRDIVHPALYSYVKGESQLIHSVDDVPSATIFGEGEVQQDREVDEASQCDYWGREYEASAKYQWLPTYFDVDVDGTCSICDYINNLVPRSDHESLYVSLAQLFSHALPLLESVYGYCRVVKTYHLRSHDDVPCWRRPEPNPISEVPVSLRGQRLQVITKIVDYELAPGQSYEGVWHVEGMSHEEIVATAIYFIDRDEDIVGGNILFKRAFHMEEADYVFSNVDQIRPVELDSQVQKGLIPLGQVETIKGRLVVFPNSHVHRVTKLENCASSGATLQKRRIIVFFLVNPQRRIVSTREVPIQQEHVGGEMKRSDALKHRLELMKERKYTKQDWNVREIELCEH